MNLVQAGQSISLLVAQLEELESVLLHEQQALKSEDFIGLEQYSEKKLAITSAIQETESRQGSSIISLIRQIDTGKLEHARHLQLPANRLIELSTRCKQLNLVNGAMLESRRRNIQLRLNILRGVSHDQALYSDKGTSVSTDNGQTLARV